LAHTIYLSLRARGYTPHQLLALASELVGSVTREARGEDP
jgi:hypothetical protein